MSSWARTTVVVLGALAGLQATAEAQSRPKADRNRITEEEIRARPASNVHDLIKSRRPNWFSVRGSGTFETRRGVDALGQSVTLPANADIIVYVDGLQFGTQESLRSMSTQDVESIERLDAASATQQFGTNHEHGAIVIRRRTR